MLSGTNNVFPMYYRNRGNFDGFKNLGYWEESRIFNCACACTPAYGYGCLKNLLQLCSSIRVGADFNYPIPPPILVVKAFYLISKVCSTALYPVYIVVLPSDYYSELPLI